MGEKSKQNLTSGYDKVKKTRKNAGTHLPSILFPLFADAWWKKMGSWGGRVRRGSSCERIEKKNTKQNRTEQTRSGAEAPICDVVE